ncbi:CGNR zinc finger domain-containing protein [Solirubrobacter phytolaccae]|uniref:CGNR zinc finger domain-containing protein n=1 Tax=Solirubrobacter phytolaccae TaxID=1404360 RepID=A0A9X3NAD6_9ACTN|nr:ABATE domain-containing protein [Solirubrobacter phytolaccae]MDA0182356.1 CGNR zinc finger domain-containing protein [Solirubrobacter phytolaccae]
MDLPAHLPLPLERGAPWWYWLAGRPALDFTNTLRERWNRRVETLVCGEDLGEWLVAAELLPATPAVTDDVLERARTLREAIDAGVVASLAGQPVPDATLIALARELPHATRPETLTRTEDGGVAVVLAEPAAPAVHGLGLLARDAAEMFGAAERIRVCASDTCSARFFDRSPAAGRRWCSSRGCGNVEKARRHRRRQKETPQ